MRKPAGEAPKKTVLERRAPPTFDVLIEIQTRDRLAVHLDVTEAVDALLRGYPLPPELRYRDQRGEIHIEKTALSRKISRTAQSIRNNFDAGATERRLSPDEMRVRGGKGSGAQSGAQLEESAAQSAQSNNQSALPTVKIYPYGVARNRLAQAAKRLEVPIVVVNEAADADALVTLRSYYRKRQHPIVEAENRGLSIFVLRANTINQMQQFLTDLFNLSTDASDDRSLEPMLQETQAAIDAVLNGERWVELQPATAYIRRLQHQMARQANLTSHSYGKEPSRRVRIFRD